MRQVVGVAAELVVEGVEQARGGAPFHGRVIAVAVGDDDDTGIPGPATTWLLVADDDRPAPFWVVLTDVSAQRLGR